MAEWNTLQQLLGHAESMHIIVLYRHHNGCNAVKDCWYDGAVLWDDLDEPAINTKHILGWIYWPELVTNYTLPKAHDTKV